MQSVAAGLAILAAGLLCMRLLNVDSTYFDLAWPMLVLSTGMPTATEQRICDPVPPVTPLECSS